MDELTHLDLFSGIGGFSLAAEACGFRTILFCEIDEFCQRVLKKHWPKTPIIPDIRDINGTEWRGATLLTGGFPCQPFSIAGQRRGKEDDCYLWPEMLRVIKETRPRWVVGENVAGIVRMELDQVLTDLENTGYSTQAIIIPACAKNAPHRRDRVWIIANAINNEYRGRGEQTREKNRVQEINRPSIYSRRIGRTSQDDSNSIGTRGARGKLRETYRCNRGEDILLSRSKINQTGWEENWLEVAASFCRVDDGLPSWIHSDRVKRLKALGNAIVPQVAKEIIKCIYQIEESK